MRVCVRVCEGCVCKGVCVRGMCMCEGCVCVCEGSGPPT